MHVAEKERMPRLSLGEEKNMVTQLLVLNITVFILLYFIRIIYQMEDYGIPAFNRDILQNTQVPADPMLLLQKPWTIITAQFAHIQFWDIFSNGVWLFCFGTLLQNISGHRLVVPLYIFGSLTGFAFYVTGMNLVPAFKPLVAGSGIMGAGAGVMALAIGVTVLAPNNRVFPLLMKGGMPVWVITLIYLALNGLAIFSSTDISYTSLLYILGGAFMGYMFISQFKRGYNWGNGINNLFFRISHVFHPKPAREAQKAEITASGSSFRARTTPTPFAKVGAPAVSEQKVNEILDKISAEGMQSLTPEEKDVLMRASREKSGEF
jgi:membrane associated rhomboid family serine protease